MSNMINLLKFTFKYLATFTLRSLLKFIYPTNIMKGFSNKADEMGEK